MNYLVFLIIFLWMPVVALIYVQRRLIRVWIILRLGVLTGLILGFVTLWASYMTAAHIWYYDVGLMLSLTFGYLPAEAYLATLLQTLLVSFGTLLLWRWFYPGDFATIA